MKTHATWYFYIARCADDTLYAGTCRNLTARFEKHNAGTGAKYTRSRRPVTLAYRERFRSQSKACQREAAVKRFSRDQKMALIRAKEQK